MIGVVGTSPRTRGKPAAQGLLGRWRREHPRARGENNHDGRYDDLIDGTSPRTRGKLHKAGKVMTMTGNIPAHAGKTSKKLLKGFLSQEHPRARGENHPTRWLSPSTTWNIPAHAGKTHPPPGNQLNTTEHPRARGENFTVAPVPWLLRGTSPRTRGKHWQYCYRRGWCRNIPAHAGKTYILADIFAAITEHPRARGENTCKLNKLTQLRGTSPRTRGKHH